MQHSPKNIIVRMPNWIGDFVMATPILADIKHAWKDASVTAMCQGKLSVLLENDPHVDELLPFQKPSGWIHRIHRSDIVDPLRMGKYDLGILLTNSFSSAWWFWRGHVQNRVGFAANGRSPFLNIAVPYPAKKETQHLVLTYKALLEPLGIPLSNTPPQLYLTPSEIEQAKETLRLQGVTDKSIVVGINPGAAYGSAKCWLPDRFKAVTAKLLKDPRVFIVYFGDPAGASLVNDICKGFSERVINLAGRTSLRELVALIKQCKVFLTNDSGPMHIAAAVGTPLVALFGSTSDVKTGPYGSGKVLHKHVECSPCYKKVCPIDFRCMTSISVDEVYDEIIKRIDPSL